MFPNLEIEKLRTIKTFRLIQYIILEYLKCLNHHYIGCFKFKRVANKLNVTSTRPLLV